MTAAAANRSEYSMHPQLMLLMELQDLRGQLAELSGEEQRSGSMEEEHFHIDLDVAREDLAAKIEELEERLEPRILSRYRQIVPSRRRVVVPVINGVCYGCFVSIPTATVGDQEVHQELQSCQNCGSFIYVVQ